MNSLDFNKIAFFGTPQFAVTVLEELKKTGITPSLVVTAPDKPQGRGLVLTPPPVKVWAQKNNIKCIQPVSLKNNSENGISEIDALLNEPWDLFIVVAYGKLIPENIFNAPKYKTLNVHPSLLPKFRGPSPIESSILNDDRDVGVSIMRLDEELDHGPIVAQESIPTEKISAWPVVAPVLEDIAAHFGGALLAKILPDWTLGKITEKEQDHARATYCQKISKAEGLIDLTADPYTNYLKICAYSGWPGTYFFKEHAGKNIRVAIKKATYQDGQLIIETVVPEGKSEMPYLDFLRGIK
jgi:methionyl-tRNA formyltransferase